MHQPSDKQMPPMSLESIPGWVEEFLSLKSVVKKRYKIIKSQLGMDENQSMRMLSQTDGADGSSDRNQDEEQEQSVDRQEKDLKRLRHLYCKKSLNFFGFDNPVRIACINIVEWKYFDTCVLLLILINTILLGLLDYVWENDKSPERGPQPTINRLQENSEMFFTIFFTAEAAIKIITYGVVMQDTCYLRDGWNILDFSVVITGLLQNIPGLQNTSGVRAFRLLRPLRSLSAIPSMRMLVTTLISSLEQIGNILILNIFFILTFSIISLQLWTGVLNFRCRATLYPMGGDWQLDGDNRICG
jgi:hypothetical protein